MRRFEWLLFASSFVLLSSLVPLASGQLSVWNNKVNLKVAVFPDDIPWTQRSANGDVIGFMPSVWDYIFKALKTQYGTGSETYDLVEYTSKNSAFADAAAGTIDVVLGFRITAYTTSFMRIPTPIYDYGQTVITYAIFEDGANYWAIFAPFSVGTWLLILASIFFLMGFSFLMTRIMKKPKDDISRGTDIWNIYLSTVGAADGHQHKGPTRVMMGYWYFAILILVALYTANLAAILTTSASRPRVTGIEQLLQQPSTFQMAIVEDSSTYFYFANHRDSAERFIAQKAILVPDANTGLDLVSNQTIDAYIGSSVESTFLADQPPCGEIAVGPVFHPVLFGIGIPQNYSGVPTYQLASVLSDIIIQVREDGSVEQTADTFLISKDCLGEEEDPDLRIYPSNLIGLYILFGIFAAVSLIAGVGSSAWRIYRNPGRYHFDWSKFQFKRRKVESV